MNITIRPRMLILTSVKCDADCGNKAEIQIQFSSSVKWCMCKRCYDELKGAMKVLTVAVAPTQMSPEHQENILQLRVDDLTDALRECGEAGEQDVLAIVQRALDDDIRVAKFVKRWEQS